MQKDVIYIDVEDDITAIVGKLKESSHDVVALVPPKRIGMLQSAVNLRLLARTATNTKKHLVIVTNNQALMSLAASAKIPVAKTLQSKPELAEISVLSIDEGEDVIDGADMPSRSDNEENLNITDSLGVVATQLDKASPPEAGKKPSVKVKKGPKVPNFNTFRKKLLLAGVAAVLLISFLVWAIFFAPKAKVILSTRTTDAAVNQPINAGTELSTDHEKGTIKAESRQIKKEVSIEFSATGKKDVGEKASGKVRIKTDATTILVSGLTVPAGTAVYSSGGSEYFTDSAAVFPQGSASALNGVVVGVTASESGSSFNGATGSAITDADGVTTVNFTETTSGGTDKTVTVATQEDIDNAMQKVDESAKVDDAKKELETQFGDNYKIIPDVVDNDKSAVKSTVAANEEASNGKATISGGVLFTMYAVSKNELSSYLDKVITTQIDNKDEQRIYDNGIKNVKFNNTKKTDKTVSVNLSANGKIGPIVDAEKVKEIAAGKGYGEVQSELDGINGVENVDIEFSPFWVRSVPDNVDKISVEFLLEDE